MFPSQFATWGVSHESFSVTPIRYLDFNGQEMSVHATGFVFKHVTGFYLITALHCLTGIDTFSGKNLSSTGFRPKTITIYPSHRLEDGNLTRATMQMSILDEDGNSLWKQDVNYDLLSTDIAVLRLVSDLPLDYVFINYRTEDDLLIMSGSDCFVLGYPLSEVEDPFLPIWRRGSLASEPGIPIDGKPVFLIDASTSRGMSGSPFIQRWFGPAPMRDNGELIIKADAAVTSRLIGVYGGRAHSYQDVGPIGYGWYANRIDAIIEGRQLEPVFDLQLSNITV